MAADSVLVATVCLTSVVASVSRQRSWVHSGVCENAVTPASPLRFSSVYGAMIMSVLLYSAVTWTLLAADLRKFEAFDAKCLRRLLRVNWLDRITNAPLLQKTDGLTTISSQLSRRLSLFGHIATLDTEVPANASFRLMTDLQTDGKKPDVEAASDLVVVPAVYLAFTHL